jgi:hypothetical protein
MVHVANTPGQLAWADGVDVAIAAAQANIVALQALPVDTGWTVATLLNSWVAFGAPTTPPQYRRRDGITYVAGNMKTGTIASGTILFNLPAGYRPLTSHRFLAYLSGGTVGLIEVVASGDVKAASALNATITAYTFSFPADA